VRDHNLGTIRPGRSFTQEELDHFARRCGFSAGQMPDPPKDRYPRERVPTVLPAFERLFLRIGLPQPPQNLAAISFSKPQTVQGTGRTPPHWAHKRLLAAFSATQLGQRIPQG